MDIDTFREKIWSVFNCGVETASEIHNIGTEKAGVLSSVHKLIEVMAVELGMKPSDVVYFDPSVNGKFIELIKRIRNHAGLGLCESKAIRDSGKLEVKYQFPDVMDHLRENKSFRSREEHIRAGLIP